MMGQRNYHGSEGFYFPCSHSLVQVSCRIKERLLQELRPLLFHNTAILDSTTTAKSTAASATVVPVTILAVAAKGRTVVRAKLFGIMHGRSAGRLLVGGGDNFGWQRQILAQILNAFILQVAIVVLPRKSDFDKAATLERLHEHENFQIGRPFNVRMGRTARIFLDDQHAFLEQVRKGSDAILLGDEHGKMLCRIFVGVKHENQNGQAEAIDHDSYKRVVDPSISKAVMSHPSPVTH
jgi:hypothetical protein